MSTNGTNSNLAWLLSEPGRWLINQSLIFVVLLIVLYLAWSYIGLVLATQQTLMLGQQHMTDLLTVVVSECKSTAVPRGS